MLAELDLDAIASHGYCFQLDLTWGAGEAGFDIVEVPNTFAERAIGESKMNGSIVREAVLRVGRWGVRRRCQQLRHLIKKSS